MGFFDYFRDIINAVIKLFSFKITLGDFSFSFLSVFIGFSLLGLIFGAIGKLFD